jgi:DNA helicase II / ATP-dependent DNA helicase PcrA
MKMFRNPWKESFYMCAAAGNLQNSYQNLIDEEYRINCFSKPDFINAVISIYSNNKKIPYILIETKSFDKNISDGIEQMKSYMANVLTSRYGVITNGNDIIVIDKEYEIVEDIPEFNTAMLPSSIENLTYVDMIHNKKLMITKNLNNPRQLSLKDSDGQSDLEEGELIALKVCSENATIRRYMKMGDSILLIPEN